MQNNKRLQSKLGGSPFTLDFPEVDPTPRTSPTPLKEEVFKKKLNREDFKSRLIKEGSFRVYYKKNALGGASESYCALVRTKNGIPAQFALVILKGNKKKVEYTSEGPSGKIISAYPNFNQFWDYLVTTVAGLPENYAMSCVLKDSRIQNVEITSAPQSTPTQQPAQRPAQQTVPRTPTASKPATPTAQPGAKPVTPTAEALGPISLMPGTYWAQNSTRRAEAERYKSGGDD